MKLSEYNDYELGFAKGVLAAKQGVPELEVLNNEPNECAREGIRAGYAFVTGISVTDSVKELREAAKQFVTDSTPVAKFNLIEAAQNVIDSFEQSPTVMSISVDGVDVVVRYIPASESVYFSGDELVEVVAEESDGSTLIAPKMDSEEYSLEKDNDHHYLVLKEGKPVYNLTKKNVNWQCDCPGFKYRGICKHIGMLKDVLPKRREISELKAFVPEIEKLFEPVFGQMYDESTQSGTWAIVGSYRRGKSTVKDIDILVECPKSEFEKKILDILQQDPNYQNTMHGPDIVRGKFNGWDFDVSRVEPGQWGSYLLYRTGNAKFNMYLRALAKKKGMSLNEHGLFNRETGELIANESEKDIFEALGLDYVEPKDREF